MAQPGRGADWGIKQCVTANAGLDGPDLNLFSVTLFAVYSPSGWVILVKFHDNLLVIH
ncbi:hypothetical protein HMPREF1568_3613 [Providencia alcalifaciens PAL-3]|uniref:hypothetical protein n=1 Tax=Providencia sp. PROV211 TaxID=2949908 RepID=UPI0003E20A7E|nr:hypothetical protein [Providencia sp. PROV211]ETS99216.1 hypothetical protein HMPREF1568_3613 [Providencia alcalifaciens PAL-3]EUC99135.1 hypothetical protein HMPREF1566_3899 [Providencia alcalifaciens PAL-1]MTC22102.1 hypothetical protein [Providencia sp. wls1938]UNJ79591.1 hypothetical protein [Providencia sp.]